MTALFAINFVVTQISPDHYRRVLTEAVESGTLATVMHLPFAPRKDLYPYGGNDCVIVGALAMPRASRIETAISPPMPTWGDAAGVTSPSDTRPQRTAWCLRQR